ncbi:DUF928 domain-containing protein [Phormidium tenue FACHB-886]|nr:DUF928 domain-containing protein [Phormidium tenue FACHB-886]
MSRSFRPQSVLLATLLTPLIALLFSPAIALAAPRTPASTTLEYVPPSPPGSDRGSPSRQTDTGTRAPCGAAAEPGVLAALIPSTGAALTVAARPTFWAYLPAGSYVLEFAIAPADENPIAVELTATSQEAGIVSIPLPAQFPDLDVDRSYQWSLSLSCTNPAQSSANRFVEGSIRRVALGSTLAKTLKSAPSARDRVAIYAENGIWYDALTTLGTAYQTEAENPAIAADWTVLLSALSIDLRDRGIDFSTEDITTAPFLECCQAE